jgi:hypothetical protein
LVADTVRDKRVGDDVIYDSLADEFRVRAAQAAVLGTTQVRLGGGVHAPVAHDLYEFYKRQTAPARYTFLTVPVEPFQAQVLGEPTEAELKKIFAEYRNIDPEPHNPKAGVREPRKIKVEWAEVTGQEAYYGPLAEAKLKQLTTARATAAAPAAAGVLGAAATRPAAFRDTGYDDYKQAHGEVVKGWAAKGANPGRPRLTEPAGAVLGGGPLGDPANADRPFSPSRYGTTKLADTTVAQPHTAGVLAGLLGGAFATGGSLMTAPTVRVAELVLTEAGYASEREQRLTAGLRAFHFPTLPGLPVLGELTGADMAVLAALPPPLPQPLVQPVLDAKTKDELRTQVALDDVRELQKQLAEVMKKDDKAAATKEAAEVVAKFIKDRGLKSDATKELRDMHTIADAPAVAPLIPKSGVADPVLNTLSNPVRKSTFGFTLFQRARAPRSPQEMQSGQPLFEPAVGLYAPVPYPDRGPTADLPEPTAASPLTLVWRTEEVRAEVPRELDEATREKCKAVWKRIKARELARKAAEEVVAEVKKVPDPATSPQLLNKHLLDAEAALKERLKPNPAGVRLIPDFKYEVAPLVRGTDRSPLAGGDTSLSDFRLPQGDDFVYPTGKMADELLANRDKPIGTAVVLADQPETTLFVAVLTSKDQADPTTFRNTILKRSDRPMSGLTGDPRDVVLARHAVDARKQAREEAVALLKAEFGYANEHPDLDKRASDVGD